MTRDFVRIESGATFDEAIEAMDVAGIRHLPVFDGGRLVGVLSERDLLETTGWLPRSVREVLEAPEGAVRDIMHAPVEFTSPADTLVSAALRLLDWGIGCLPVLDEQEVVGILTEADVLDAYVAQCEESGSPNDPLVETLMSTDVVAVEADAPAEEALERMRAEDVRHLPVLEGGKLRSIVSDRDFRLFAGRGQLEGTPVGELAPDLLFTTEVDAPLSRAAWQLSSYRVSALPVLDRGELAGILTTADVLAHCVEAFGRHAPAR